MQCSGLVSEKGGGSNHHGAVTESPRLRDKGPNLSDWASALISFPNGFVDLFSIIWYTPAHTKSTWMSSGCAIFVEVER